MKDVPHVSAVGFFELLADDPIVEFAVAVEYGVFCLSASLFFDGPFVS